MVAEAHKAGRFLIRTLIAFGRRVPANQPPANERPMDQKRISEIRGRWTRYKLPAMARSDLHALLTALIKRDEKIAKLEAALDARGDCQ